MRRFGRKVRTPVRAAAQVVAATQPAANAMWSPIELTLVVRPEGQPPRTVEYRKRVARNAKFPFPGQTIPVELDADDPAAIEVLWDELPSRREVVRAQADGLAGAMGGSGPPRPGAAPTGAALPRVVAGSPPPDLPHAVSDLADQVRRALPDAQVEVRAQGAPTAAARPASGADPTDRLALLERLAALRDAGVLTAEELEAEKARLLGR